MYQKVKDYLNEESKTYFDTVCALLDELEIPYEIDDQLVRGLDYYTHTVFEIVSLNKEMGAQSTVLAGGRYDGLIPYFGRTGSHEWYRLGLGNGAFIDCFGGRRDRTCQKCRIWMSL